MKYLRSYPWGLQLLLFGMMVLTMSGVGGLLVLTFLSRVSPYTFTQMSAIDEHSPAGLVTASIAVHGVLSLFIFLIPALVFGYLATPRPAAYLGLRVPGKRIQPLLAVGVVLGAMPILQAAEALIAKINFGAKIAAQQAANESMMKAFLKMPTFSSFIITFIVMAVIAAVGEELFFRGVLLRFTRKHSRSMVLPIVVTSIVFALVHSNVYGFVSIFAAGTLLAVIYNLTGSLWCNILGHLSFNGFQVIIAYLAGKNSAVKSFEESNHVPVLYVLGGVIVFVISFYLLLKNKTPLPANWTDDYTPDEISENAV